MGAKEEDAARRAALAAAQKKGARAGYKYWASARLLGYGAIGALVLSILVGWFRQSRYAISTRATDRAEKQFLSGNIYFEAGDLGTAVRHYKMAVATNPYHADAWTNLGNALSSGIQQASTHRDRIYEDAVKAYQQAVLVERRHVDAHFNLGVLHHTMEKVDLAIPAYERAVRLDPLHHDALSNLGSARHKVNDLPGAIKAYSEAIRIVGLLDETQVDHQMLSMLYYLLGSAVSSQDDNKCRGLPCAQQAAHHVRKALAINNANEEAAEALAGMRTDTNVTEAAQQLAGELFVDYEKEMERVALNGVSYRVPGLIRSALDKARRRRDLWARHRRWLRARGDGLGGQECDKNAGGDGQGRGSGGEAEKRVGGEPVCGGVGRWRFGERQGVGKVRRRQEGGRVGGCGYGGRCVFELRGLEPRAVIHPQGPCQGGGACLYRRDTVACGG